VALVVEVSRKVLAVVNVLLMKGSVGPQDSMLRADVHHPEDAIMTDAPKAAMRNDTENRSRKRARHFTCGDVDGK